MKKIFLFAAMALFTLTASAQVKFAYVDFNEIVMLMPESDAARTQMQTAQKEANETYESLPGLRPSRRARRRNSLTSRTGSRNSSRLSRSSFSSNSSSLWSLSRRRLLRLSRSLRRPVVTPWSSIPASSSTLTSPSARILLPTPGRLSTSLPEGLSRLSRRSSRHSNSSNNLIIP